MSDKYRNTNRYMAGNCNSCMSSCMGCPTGFPGPAGRPGTIGPTGPAGASGPTGGVHLSETLITINSNPWQHSLMELGYAIKPLKMHRIVLLLNTKTGTPDDFPFDIRKYRVLPFEWSSITVVIYIHEQSNDTTKQSFGERVSNRSKGAKKPKGAEG